MTIKTRQVTVGDTPTLICKPASGDATVRQWGNEVISTVYLGGPDVTTETGWPMSPYLEDLDWKFDYSPQEASDDLYGIAPPGQTVVVRVFEIGKV